MTSKKRTIFKIFSFIIAVSLLVSIIPHFSIMAKAVENSDRIIVSMGDSYSSGEGIEPYYGSDITPLEKKVKDQNWLSHRSKKSWPGQLSLDAVGKMSDESNINNHWYFVAMSGAITKNILDESIATEEDKKDDNKKYKFKEYQKDIGLGKGKNDALKGEEPIDCQLKVFDEIKEKGQAVDYVTLTMGGNDAGFVDILKTAATKASYLGPNETYDKLMTVINNDLPEIKKNLHDCYTTIYERSQANIIVAGYPELLGFFGASSSPIKNGALVTLIGGTALTPFEANMINAAVEVFNGAIKAVVEECDDTIPIYFVSVEDAFKNKGAYSADAYINGLQLNPLHMLSQEELDDWNPIGGASFHPNEKGVKAYAECVQDKIDYLECAPRQKPTEKPTDKAVEIPTHKPSSDADQRLQDKLNDLISEHGIASTETYSANINTTDNKSWTNREGIVSARLSDLDGDGTNELVVVRLIGGNLNPYSENVEIQVYCYTSEGVKSAGSLKFLTGDDFNQKQIDAFICKIGNQKYIMIESDFTRVSTDVSEMYYNVIGYENGKIFKDRCVYRGASDFGARWIEQTWDGDAKSEQDIYFKDLKHTTPTGTYKNSDDPIRDYFKDFGLPETEDTFELSRHHKYLNADNNEKLFELIHSVKQTDLYKYTSSLSDFTDLDHSKSTTSAEKVDEWKGLYITHFKEGENKSILDYATFHIVDVDENGTPELVYTGFAAMGTHMVWIKDGKVYDQAVGYGDFKYNPAENQVYCQWVNHGIYSDNVFSFTNQDLANTFSGQILPEENGFENRGWLVDGENVTESEYNNLLNSSFDFASSESLDYEDVINGSDLLRRIKEY